MRFRAAAIALTAVVAVVLGSGCGGGGTPVFTRSGTGGHVVAINNPWSNQLVAKYFSNQCNIDANHNGTPGGPQDRAYCLLDNIRLAAVATGLIPKSGVLHDTVYNATNHREWSDINGAIKDVMHQTWDLGNDTCLTVDVASNEDNVILTGPLRVYHINWTYRNNKVGVCLHYG
jgi:hypothetical protein